MVRGVLLVWCLGACHTPPGFETEQFCTIACDCLEPSVLPGDQQTCIEGCIAQTTRTPSAACLQCVDEHAAECAALIEDCDPACNMATPIVVGGGS